MVELVVAMALTAILATSVVTVMHPAVSIFLKVQKHTRAQMVADTIADTLRAECASSYIKGYGDARVVSVGAESDHTKGDDKIFSELSTQSELSDPDGNVLFIRKNEGYAEALYCNAWISQNDYDDVRKADQGYKAGNVTSKAVYRFFPAGAGVLKVDEMPVDTRQGYLHSAYYETSSLKLDIDGKKVDLVRPTKAYDYTNPFTNDSYNGYTVKLLFSDLSYTIASDETEVSGYTQRPASVKVTVEVYKSGYGEQSASTLIYTRTALLLFAEDTTK